MFKWIPFRSSKLLRAINEITAPNENSPSSNWPVTRGAEAHTILTAFIQWKTRFHESDRAIYVVRFRVWIIRRININWRWCGINWTICANGVRNNWGENPFERLDTSLLVNFVFSFLRRVKWLRTADKMDVFVETDYGMMGRKSHRSPSSLRRVNTFHQQVKKLRHWIWQIFYIGLLT